MYGTCMVHDCIVERDAAAGQPPGQLSSQAAGPGGLLMLRDPGPSCLTAELAWRLAGRQSCPLQSFS